MWDLIVSIPDHCLSFYFDVFDIIEFLISQYIYDFVMVYTTVWNEKKSL